MNEYDDDFELDRDVKLKDFRPMDREVYDEDIEDVFRGNKAEYEDSMRRERAAYKAIEEEQEKIYRDAQRKGEIINGLIYFIPVFIVLLCFISDARASGFFLFIKFIFAINGGYCLLKIVDNYKKINQLRLISYIGLVITGLIGISGIVGARYDRDFWLFIDALYCILKALSFLSGLANNV